MRFKTDENLPLEASTILLDAGFDVETIWDEALSGAADEVVAARVRAEARVLVTLDLDFANIQAYPPDQHAGIIVLRPKTQHKPTVLAYIARSSRFFTAGVRSANCGLCNVIASAFDKAADWLSLPDLRGLIRSVWRARAYSGNKI